MSKEQKIDYTDVKSLGAKLRRDLDSLCTAKIAISSEIFSLKKDEEILRGKAQQMVIANKLGNIMASTWRINHGWHETIDKTKLLENGVSMETIQRCTNRTPTIVISRRKTKEDNK